jgi:hypothetical protein
VVVDANGRVVDLNAAHDTPVRYLRESERDSNHLEVAFWAYSPICVLTRDHPEFERIRATLAQAAGTPRLLWVATHSGEKVEGEPEEDGLIPAYPTILEVRPIELASTQVDADTPRADGAIPRHVEMGK